MAAWHRGSLQAARALRAIRHDEQQIPAGPVADRRLHSSNCLAEIDRNQELRFTGKLMKDSGRGRKYTHQILKLDLLVPSIQLRMLKGQ